MRRINDYNSEKSAYNKRKINGWNSGLKGKKKLQKVVAVLLFTCLLVTTTIGLLPVHTYAYTEEEKAQAKSWLSSHGYAPTRAGADAAYQDYLDGKWADEFGDPREDGQTSGGDNIDESKNEGANSTDDKNESEQMSKAEADAFLSGNQYAVNQVGSGLFIWEENPNGDEGVPAEFLDVIANNENAVTSGEKGFGADAGAENYGNIQQENHAVENESNGSGSDGNSTEKNGNSIESMQSSAEGTAALENDETIAEQKKIEEQQLVTKKKRSLKIEIAVIVAAVLAGLGFLIFDLKKRDDF